MAGHSKWANIRHRKAGQDAKRGKVFTKIIRELTVAAKSGGGNPEDNPRLRAAMDKANGANMPKDTIERAVARGAGGADTDTMEELVYEGYGTGGVAILVEVLTDNRNRTVAEVRHAFSKSGGNLGTDGSVAYLFTHTGIISLAHGVDEDQVMDVAIDAGAQDVLSNDDGSVDVLTNLETFGAVKDALVALDISFENAEMTMLASNQVDLDQVGAEKLMRLTDMLEDLDDVQNVYSNAEISEEIMQALS